MIQATFIKAVPLKDGTISYMLSGKRTKEALRLAVDLQDEECTIDIERAGTIISDSRLDKILKAISPIIKEHLAETFADGTLAGALALDENPEKEEPQMKLDEGGANVREEDTIFKGEVI
jgi:hypothetical protein